MTLKRRPSEQHFILFF